jgi:hypothetical protein
MLIKKGWLTSEIFNKWLISCDVGLQRTSRKVLLVLENYADTLKISVPQQQFPGRTNGHENNKKNLKTLYDAKLVNYLLETIQENLTSSSTAKEVSARIDVLLSVQIEE